MLSHERILVRKVCVLPVRYRGVFVYSGLKLSSSLLRVHFPAHSVTTSETLNILFPQTWLSWSFDKECFRTSICCPGYMHSQWDSELKTEVRKLMLVTSWIQRHWLISFFLPFFFFCRGVGWEGHTELAVLENAFAAAAVEDGWPLIYIFHCIWRPISIWVLAPTWKTF